LVLITWGGYGCNTWQGGKKKKEKGGPKGKLSGKKFGTLVLTALRTMGTP